MCSAATTTAAPSGPGSAKQQPPLEMREVLLERAHDSRIAGVGLQLQRLPETKGSLQRAGVGIQPQRRGIRAPPARPQCAEVAAAAPPQPRPPLAEVEVPERMVHPGRLPVEDAGQP